MVNRRRSELDIINEILQISNKGVNKTTILYRCNLSYTQLVKYLNFLLEKNILEEKTSNNNGYSKTLYTTTEKGKDFLKDINKTLCYFG